MFSPQEINDVILRARRALLIISDRIQNKFLYLYSKEYAILKGKQYDIYILYKVVKAEFPYTPYDDNYYPLVSVLISKCEEVDAFNSDYNTLNPNYSNIDSGETVWIPIGNVDVLEVIKTEANIFPSSDPEYILLTDDEGNQLPDTIQNMMLYTLVDIEGVPTTVGQTFNSLTEIDGVKQLNGFPSQQSGASPFTIKIYYIPTQ